MTEEAKNNNTSDFALVADLMQSGGDVVSLPPGSLQVSADGGETWIDVDASWNGNGSLDEHRQKELAKVKQPGFGDAGKAKSNGE